MTVDTRYYCRYGAAGAVQAPPARHAAGHRVRRLRGGRRGRAAENLLLRRRDARPGPAPSIPPPPQTAPPEGRAYFYHTIEPTFGCTYNEYSNQFTRVIGKSGFSQTISGDSAASHRSSYRSLTSRMLGRGLSTTLTLNSVDGSNSTILLEDWRPIFDKFDREIDGKQVGSRYAIDVNIMNNAHDDRQDGKIPLEKFIEILEEDPVWKESVPKPLKDKIIKEVSMK